MGSWKLNYPPFTRSSKNWWPTPSLHRPTPSPLLILFDQALSRSHTRDLGTKYARFGLDRNFVYTFVVNKSVLVDWHQVQEEYRLHLDLAMLQFPLYCERDCKIEIVRDRVSCSKMGYFKDANSHVLKAFILQYFHSMFFGETLLLFFLCLYWNISQQE